MTDYRLSEEDWAQIRVFAKILEVRYHIFSMARIIY